MYVPQQIIVRNLPSRLSSKAVFLAEFAKDAFLAVQILPVETFIVLPSDVNVVQNLDKVHPPVRSGNVHGPRKKNQNKKNSVQKAKFQIEQKNCLNFPTLQKIHPTHHAYPPTNPRFIFTFPSSKPKKIQ